MTNTNNQYLSMNEFVTALKRFTLARRTRYNVKFNIPRILMNETKELSLMCERINIPGTQIMTVDFKPYGGKPTIAIPKYREYDDFRVTFLVQESFIQKHVFENWIYYITNYTTNNVSYFDDIVSNVVIQVFSDTELEENIENNFKERLNNPNNWSWRDRYNSVPTPAIPRSTQSLSSFFYGTNKQAPYVNGWTYKSFKPTVIYEIELLNAYPTRVEGIPMDWNISDNIVEMDISFKFEQIKFKQTFFTNVKKYEHIEKTF